jgi:hypothetical protein
VRPEPVPPLIEYDGTAVNRVTGYREIVRPKRRVRQREETGKMLRGYR